MSRVELDKNLGEIIALLPEVQEVIDDEMVAGAMRAQRNLAVHYAEGDASITVSKGHARSKNARKQDRLVEISDERGLGVAMSIEYGRKPGTTNPRGPSYATWILHDAFGLKRRRPKRLRRKRSKKGV